MEEALLQGGESAAAPTRQLFVEELKKVSYIAAPMVVVTVSQTLSRVASMMMVGHLGELALSGAAVAISFANVTGFSILVMPSFLFPFQYTWPIELIRTS